MQLFYSPAYVGANHAFATTRKAGWVADSLVTEPLAGVSLLAPDPLPQAELQRVHDAAYIEAVRTGTPRALAEAQELRWDPGLWSMTLASNGGAVAAALAALEHGTAGSLSSGLHHARRARGAGYCTFNGLALAALRALECGARRVLILDLDAHCGGGTASLVGERDDIWQIDVSVDAYDRYTSTESVRLHMVDDATRYLGTVWDQLTWLQAHGPRFDLCLYNAGMDPCEGCPDGALAGITPTMLAQREAMVFAWCRQQRLPVAFLLAGGYVGPHLDTTQLVALHRLTVVAACQLGPARPLMRASS